jgi:hypothetical protein
VRAAVRTADGETAVDALTIAELEQFEAKFASLTAEMAVIRALSRSDREMALLGEADGARLACEVEALQG